MGRNEVLQVDLLVLLKHAKNNLDKQAKNIYQEELEQLNKMIQQSLIHTRKNAFFKKKDVVKCLMDMLCKIDKKIQGEKDIQEFDLTRNSNAISTIPSYLILKNTLKKMLEMILAARLEVKDIKVKQMLKELK